MTPAKHSRNHTLRAWIAVTLGMSLIAMTLLISTRNTDEIARKRELTAEFEQSAAPASTDFAEHIQAAYATLEAQIREGMSRVADEFAEDCVDSDGVTARIKGEDDAKQMLTKALRDAVSELVSRCLEDFRDSVEGAEQLLQARLLATTPFGAEVSQTVAKCAENLRAYSPEPPVSELRGGGWGKTLDEGFAWIPIVGDIYDTGKLIFGDPRENGIRTRAHNYVHGEEAKVLAYISLVKPTLPDAATTERACRAAFKPEEALARLNSE